MGQSFEGRDGSAELIQTAALLFVKSHLQEVVQHPNIGTLPSEVLVQLLRLLAKENRFLKQEINIEQSSEEESSTLS